jgi:hypothetical protein
MNPINRVYYEQKARQPLYDAMPITGHIELFELTVGQIVHGGIPLGKTYQHTNNYGQNHLPSYNSMLIDGIRLEVTGSEAFRRKFESQGYLELSVDSKIELTLGPLGAFMPGSRFMLEERDRKAGFYVLDQRIQLKDNRYFRVRLGNWIEAPKELVYCYLLGAYLRASQ